MYSIAIEEVSQEHLQNNPHRNEIVYTGQKRSLDGSVKFNLMECVQSKGELAGILRQSDGRWIKGFSHKIGGNCDALHVEMCNLYLGLDIAWSEGFSHLIVQKDSKVLIEEMSDEVN